MFLPLEFLFHYFWASELYDLRVNVISAGICFCFFFKWHLIVCAGSAMFDASQYAFFGKDIMDGMELGGLEDEAEVVPSFGGGFGGDEELNEYHLFEKDEVNMLNGYCGIVFSVNLDVLLCYIREMLSF